MRTAIFVLILGALLPGMAAAQGEIIGWGSQVVVGQEALSDLIAVSAGGSHSLGLKSDGSIVAWGDNGAGQCNLPAPNMGFVSVSAGGSHSLGLKADGRIVAWGNGPGNPPAPNTDFVAVAAGDGHSLGLKADGSIIEWPTSSVPAPNTGFVAIATSVNHNLGLKANGSIVGWGSNGSGECDVPAPNTGFVAVAAGHSYSLGLKTDGSIVAWGNNGDGQCNVPAPNSGFVVVAAGGAHSLGLKAMGTIVAWGSNGQGQCNVPAPNTDFVAVAAGDGHSFGLKADGSIVAWGWGPGDPLVSNTGFVAVAAASWHSLGLKSDESIVAWGDNGAGQCNVPAPNTDFVAMAATGGIFWVVVGPGMWVCHLAGSNLGLKANGSIVAWGSGEGDLSAIPAPNTDFVAVAVAGNFFDAGGVARKDIIPGATAYCGLGLKADGSTVSWGSWGPGDPPAPNTDFVAVAMGGGDRDWSQSPLGNHSLGLRSDGSIIAWGDNSAGQCNIPAPNTGFVAVAAGRGRHNLGLKDDGSIVAWGDNSAGQCNVPAPNTGFVAVSAGLDHSLGLKADGSIVAWGDNGAGQCSVPTLNTGFVAIAAGATHSLALYDPAGVGVEQPWQPDPEHNLQKAPAARVINQPNPFNPNTEIRYWMERGEGVTVRVYDLRGREVCELVSTVQPAGWNAVRWDGRDAGGRNVPTGVYFARMETESRTVSCRMMLVR